MARIEAEARVDGNEWRLVFKNAGWQKMLRVDGYFAGYDTFREMRSRFIHEKLEILNAEVKNGAKVQSSLLAYSKIDGELRKYHSSVVSGRRTTDPRDLGPDPPRSPSPTAAALWGGRGGRETNGEGSEDLSRGRDVVLGRPLEEWRCSPWLSPASTADNRYKRRTTAEKLFASSKTQVPVGRLLSAAEPLADTFAASPYMDDEEFDSSLYEVPLIRHEVDNFIIHTGEEMVSLTNLPVYIGGVQTGGSNPPEKIYLVGTVGRESKMFKKTLRMWRLVLDPSRRPSYLVKTKKDSWVRLRNPQEEYRKLMSDVLALGHFLNFVKKLPNASPKAAEQDLRRTCSMHGANVQLDRLSRHFKVISSFIEEDKELASAPIMRKIFPNLFSERSFPEVDEESELEDRRASAGVKRKVGRLPLMSEVTERKEKRYKVMAKKSLDKPKLLKASTTELQNEDDTDCELKKRNNSRGVKRKAVDAERLHLHRDDGSGTEVQPRSNLRNDVHKRIFTRAEVNVEDPPICIICDDGGDLIYCDGPCHRHFHPTKGSGMASFCATLRMTEAEVEAKGKYYCLNCKHKQQQCFICGELGSSAASSDGPQEVRRCDVPFCSRFFHGDCVAEMLCNSKLDWKDLADAFNDGDEKLVCPRHCCLVCGKAELEEPGMLVQCRRCPKAWHRACLVDFPRSMQKPSLKIWNQHDREFIYCREHKILPKTQTPARDHVRFPGYEAKED